MAAAGSHLGRRLATSAVVPLVASAVATTPARPSDAGKQSSPSEDTALLPSHAARSDWLPPKSWTSVEAVNKNCSNRRSLKTLVNAAGAPVRRRVLGKRKAFRCLGSICEASSAPSGSLNSDIANLHDVQGDIASASRVKATGKRHCPLCKVLVPVGSKKFHLRTRHPEAPKHLFMVERPQTVAVS